MEIVRAVQLISLVLSAQGCALVGTIVPVRKYEPWVAPSIAVTEARWTALPAVLAFDGWRVIASDDAHHRVLAVRDHAHEALRDHVTITIEEAKTRIALRTGVTNDAIDWDAAVVCSNYSFARERDLFALVESAAIALAEQPAPLAHLLPEAR